MNTNELLEKALIAIQMNNKVKDQYIKEENYDMYGHMVCVVTSQIQLLLHMGLITFEKYKELNDECYGMEA